MHQNRLKIWFLCVFHTKNPIVYTLLQPSDMAVVAKMFVANVSLASLVSPALHILEIKDPDLGEITKTKYKSSVLDLIK